jgi:nucleoside-diphosphate-sugar epimerase
LSTVLVTGATGLIGSNVCAALVGARHRVRALVRPGSRATEIEELGAEIFRGDVTSGADVAAAADGCEYCIHTAALVVGGPPRPYADYEAVNVVGTRNVLDATQDRGMRRLVCLGTSASFDRTSTLTEDVHPLADRGGNDFYASTKLLAYEETAQRVASGLDAVTILPGGFGPAPTLARAIEPPGLNHRIVRALSGVSDPMPAYRLSPILASDTARTCVSALTRGRPGETYLAFGRPQDVTDSVAVLNLALEHAGRPYRIRALTDEELRRPEAPERYGPSVVRAALESAEPMFSNELTVERLGHDPTPLVEAVATTVAWMVDHQFV